LLALRAALAGDGDLLSPDERAAIDAAIAAVDTAKAGADRNAIHDAVEALDRATQDFASRRMDRGISAALRGVAVDSLAQRIRAAD